MNFRKISAKKILTSIILAGFVLSFVAFILRNRVLYPLKGYVSDDDKEHKGYYQTLLNSYDPEPSWKPASKFDLKDEPVIAGSSAILVDLGSDGILFDKGSNEKRKIASITKIMTAVVALEHKSLSDEIPVSKKAASIGENSMGISEGEAYTLEELLYGLMSSSGNDAAYAIAEGVAGSSEEFVAWMEIKSKELGLRDTYFADPSGLDDSTYSTPLDLVKLARYAMKNPKFREIVKTKNKELISETHKYLYLENQLNLLSTYPGVAGVKAGYTEDAGLCLVTYATNDKKEVLGAVLNSIDRKGDMILMLDYGFSKLGVKVEHHLLD